MRRSPITPLIIICAAAAVLLAACSDAGETGLDPETATSAPATAVATSPTATATSSAPTAETVAPTVAPAGTAVVSTGEVSAGCVPEQPGELQDVTRTPASPYFVHQPNVDRADAPTVVFLSGGRGSRSGARRAWNDVLSTSEQAGAFRVVLPYSEDIDFIDDARRTFAILTSATRCGLLTARQRCSAASISLNAIASPAAREPAPLVTRVR